MCSSPVTMRRRSSMHIRQPKKIVLLGMMTRMPVAGVVWQTMQYAIGFSRLGYDVYYVEAHGCMPLHFILREDQEGTQEAVEFLAKVMQRFDFTDRWAYHALHSDGRYYGRTEQDLKELYRSADIIINLHGGTVPLPEHYATDRLIYLETDPVEMQIHLHDNNPAAIEHLAPHRTFFTFGESYGTADCALPVSPRFKFLPTRQPVVMDFWE